MVCSYHVRIVLSIAAGNSSSGRSYTMIRHQRPFVEMVFTSIRNIVPLRVKLGFDTVANKNSGCPAASCSIFCKQLRGESGPRRYVPGKTPDSYL